MAFAASGRLANIANRINGEMDKVNESSRSDRELENTTGVIYKAECLKCAKRGEKMYYIGETGRNLRERMKEHLRDIRVEDIGRANISAVATHSRAYHGEQPVNNNWGFDVLEVCKKTQDRRTIEAYVIDTLKPKLNRDQGVNIILRHVKF